MMVSLISKIIDKKSLLIIYKFKLNKNRKKTMVSREQVARLVNDKETMYQAMIRNGYVLPSYKQAICTLDFMLRVRAGEVWVPRGNECRAIKVATPPPR